MDTQNPVIEDAEFAYKATNLVRLNDRGIRNAAAYIHEQIKRESYTPRTWRTHPLHLLPPEPFDSSHTATEKCLNWIFLVSAINFSFWSECDERTQYAVDWKDGWKTQKRKTWTGYWSLLAAINRAMDEGIDIINPSFYASETQCSDALIKRIFRPARQSSEDIALLQERIAVMREVGSILTAKFDGSFLCFIKSWRSRYGDHASVLDLVRMVTDTFPSFRDEQPFNGRTVRFWKRAQILVAETWAAFYPPSSNPADHPFFPDGIHQLTMFADYRVPQILHHLKILDYPPLLAQALKHERYFPSGCVEEISIRAASILAVEHVKDAILDLLSASKPDSADASSDICANGEKEVVCSVLIDFYLWDLAKWLEQGERGIEGIETNIMLPAHRTRSIWY
ncbi:hypothetical protein PUNSTDRAFT_81854 [Punctularia strigosozonata HHB-11173 SS5]|uniref:uncharacterized protein n=1 Tax=Punctularia strigosozonata (strain HHB-11173) TaxID=741275 RepID=UPI0004417DF6|nr:uncharacterized protein PUNSTDRAFT_81854 [Punctularia strigosozonata HHB-11173 SS5]EIN12572.1 hypothetical protein PUNSTDRAFT_81854 [Punctularia strigosozonata HHB-11173 SS5]